MVRWNSAVVCGLCRGLLFSASCLAASILCPGTVEAGWPFFVSNGPARGTPEWYEAHAADPPGARQRYSYGKLWPAVPRPVGPPQPLIHKYHSAHYWPHPYVCEDQSIVRNVLQMQVDNGWQEATTLHWYHFDPETQLLNSSGQEHLRWLLTHAPIEYRQAHVASASDPEINTRRVAAVEQAIAGMLGPNGQMAVLLRATDPVATPAIQVYNIFEKAEAGRGAPAIPFTQATGQSSGN